MAGRTTIIDRMLQASGQYRLDQPDDHTVAIYGPDGFHELHGDFAEAYRRKEELALLAAVRAIAIPTETMIEAGNAAMAGGQVVDVWQAFLGALIADYEACHASAGHRTAKDER